MVRWWFSPKSNTRKVKYLRRLFKLKLKCKHDKAAFSHINRYKHIFQDKIFLQVLIALFFYLLTRELFAQQF
jgi:hypothetical protein